MHLLDAANVHSRCQAALRGREEARNTSRPVIYTWSKGDRWTRKLLSEQQICNNVHAWQQQGPSSGPAPTGWPQTQAIMPIVLAGAM
jgi:hypothetical protein